jgi:phosphoglycerate dehydrogenase-like enzyme
VRPHLLVLGELPEVWADAKESLGKITNLEVAATATEAASLLPAAEVVVLVDHTGPWLEKNWEQARKLQWVQSSSTGVEDVLFPALRQSSVLLTNSRGAYAQPLAEFVMFCVLYFAKAFPVMERNRLERRWEVYPVEEIGGQTIGIVGLGTSGVAVARMAKAMGMRVVAIRRRPDRPEEGVAVDKLLPPSGLGALLSEADHVVNTLPLTSETRGLFDEGSFRAMKPSATFINIGRGATVREPALIQALRQGSIRGAGLDVFETEPLPPESELYTLPNVILSPHCADKTDVSERRVADLVVDNVQRFIAGQPLRNVTDKQAGY